jgi:hypothetical protein
METKVQGQGVSPNDAKRVLYAVLKLNTKVEVEDVITRSIKEYKLNGIEGYIPVYASEEEAKTASENGRFDVVRLEA